MHMYDCEGPEFRHRILYLHHAVEEIYLEKTYASVKQSELPLQAAAEKLTSDSEKSCANPKIIREHFLLYYCSGRNLRFFRASLAVRRHTLQIRRTAQSARAMLVAAQTVPADGPAPPSNATARGAAARAQLPRPRAIGLQLARTAARRRALSR